MNHSPTTNANNPTRVGRTRTRTATTLVTATIAGLLILSGCTTDGDSPAPGTTPTNTSSSSSSPTGTPATTTKPASPTSTAAVYTPATAQGPAQNVPVPVLPEKAKEFSKEGLIAFAEHWYSTLGYVFETGDSDPMMAITDAGCKTCAFINEPVGQWYADHGWAVGGQIEVVQSTSPFTQMDDGAYQVVLVVLQRKVSYYTADGTLSSELPQAKAKANIVNATYAEGQWTAQTAEILK